MLVHLDNTAHHAAIVLKMAVPIGITDHQIRSAVGAMLIGGVEEAAKIRLNAHCVEVVPRHFVAPGLAMDSCPYPAPLAARMYAVRPSKLRLRSRRSR